MFYFNFPICFHFLQGAGFDCKKKHKALVPGAQGMPLAVCQDDNLRIVVAGSNTSSVCVDQEMSTREAEVASVLHLLGELCSSGRCVALATT